MLRVNTPSTQPVPVGGGPQRRGHGSAFLLFLPAVLGPLNSALSTNLYSGVQIQEGALVFHFQCGYPAQRFLFLSGILKY